MAPINSGGRRFPQKYVCAIPIRIRFPSGSRARVHHRDKNVFIVIARTLNRTTHKFWGGTEDASGAEAQTEGGNVSNRSFWYFRLESGDTEAAGGGGGQRQNLSALLHPQLLLSLLARPSSSSARIRRSVLLAIIDFLGGWWSLSLEEQPTNMQSTRSWHGQTRLMNIIFNTKSW